MKGQVQCTFQIDLHKTINSQYKISRWTFYFFGQTYPRTVLNFVTRSKTQNYYDQDDNEVGGVKTSREDPAMLREHHPVYHQRNSHSYGDQPRPFYEQLHVNRFDQQRDFVYQLRTL